MLSKLITKPLRPLGLFLIFIFSALSIIWSLMLRDLDSSKLLGKIADYTVSFDNRFYDFRMKEAMDPKFVSENITIVNIDDYSLQKIGSWPIPRTVHAQMIRKLKHFGATVVGLDIMFPEKAPVCGETSPDDDLAQAISEFQAQGQKIFVGYTVTSDAHEEVFTEAPAELMNDMVDVQTSSDANLLPKKVARYTFPNQTLADSGVGLAFINNEEDNDGIFRHYQLVANVDTLYYGSLGYNVYSAFADKKPVIKINPDGSGIAEVGNSKMEISNRGEVKIRYMGGKENFYQIPLYDLLEAKEDDQKVRSLLEGKMVFVGSTATGAHDLRPSPLDPKMPGVFAHINIAEMMQKQFFYKPSDESVKISLVILVLGIMFLLLAQRLASATADLVTVVALIAGVYYLDRIHFLPQGYELKLFYCFFCFLASYSWNTFLNFMEASKEKKQIKGTFARYVAPTIVDEMLQDPEKLVVGGFRRDITCLFSDVRDFTSISEGLSATELAHSLNIYMGKMTDIVFDTKGTLDKYIGDAIVAFWGAPLEIGNHAQFAVEGAITMMETLPAINEEFRKLGRPEFKVGIGLNSGECNVGNMGSDRIFSYTALGDNMNLGARLESLCKHYGAQILISEYTLARLDTTNIKYRPIDRVIVKGKTTPVAIFEVLHKFHDFSNDAVSFAAFSEAHALFLKREFKQAYELFHTLSEKYPEDKPSKRFKEICLRFTQNPELALDNFDVTKMTEK